MEAKKVLEKVIADAVVKPSASFESMLADFQKAKLQVLNDTLTLAGKELSLLLTQGYVHQVQKLVVKHEVVFEPAGDGWETKEIRFQEERPFSDDEKNMVREQASIQFDEDFSKIYKSVIARFSETMEHELKTFVDSGNLKRDWLKLAPIEVEIMVEKAADMRGPIPKLILENEEEEQPVIRQSLLSAGDPIVGISKDLGPNSTDPAALLTHLQLNVTSSAASQLFLN